MKKNITINLCGRLFAIDEDAYELLSTYEQSLRNYFRQREGGEEIADDIEARIAELLDELKRQGTEAINIDHVHEVIHRIGKPEEMEGPLSAPEGATDATSTARQGKEAPSVGSRGAAAKRLYRNPLDKKLMGVLSGFAAYFGGDVLWWRLAFVVCVLMSFVGSSFNFLWFLPHHHLYFDVYFGGIALIVLYILLAFLMPVAETPEDRLRMKGKEVNPQNLADEISHQYTSPKDDEAAGTQSANGTGHAPAGHKGPRGCVSGAIGCIGGFFVALWAVITGLFRWCIYACGFFLAIMCLVGIISLLAIALNPSGWMAKSGGILTSPELAAVIPDLTASFYIFVLAAMLVLAITAYAIIHSLLNEFRQMPSMPYRQRIALLVMWITGLVAGGAALGYGLPKFIDADEAYNKRTWQEMDALYREEHTHDGIFVQPHEWEWLQEGGWKILNAEGCNDRFTAHGEYLTGDRKVRYLDCYDAHHRQRYRVERSELLQPGTYRLTCAARANGTGACIYAIVGDQHPLFKDIPATGNVGGDIQKSVRDSLDQIRASRPDSADASAPQQVTDHIHKILSANNYSGFG